MEFFNIPGFPIDDQAPVNTLHIWKWLDQIPNEELKQKATLLCYLESHGFIKGQHKITEDEIRTLDDTLDNWWRTLPCVRRPCRFEELFTPAKDNELSYWVRGREGRYVLNPEAETALISRGWVYSVHPETTYFEIIKNRVYAKYQTIIGSRKLANLIGE